MHILLVTHIQGIKLYNVNLNLPETIYIHSQARFLLVRNLVYVSQPFKLSPH